MIDFRVALLASLLVVETAAAETVEPLDVPAEKVRVAETIADAAAAILAPDATQPVVASKPGHVLGEVLYVGPEPTDRVRLPKQAASCGKEIADERLLLGSAREGGAERPLRNAVVWLEKDVGADSVGKSVKSASAQAERMVEIDQRQCRFVPRVAALRAGETVRFHNGDRTLHTVLLEQDGKTLWKRAMPVPGQRLQRRLDEPGRIFVRCEAGHHWAVAHLHVFPHEWFAVTNENGAFELPQLPQGKHTLVVWHEQLGEQRREVEVSESDGARVRFIFRAPAFAPKPED